METIERLTRAQLADRIAVTARLRRLTEAGGDSAITTLSSKSGA